MDPDLMSPDDRRAYELLTAPQRLERLPDGSYRIEKGGLVGVGPTPRAAAEDMASKFVVAFTRPPL